MYLNSLSSLKVVFLFFFFFAFIIFFILLSTYFDALDSFRNEITTFQLPPFSKVAWETLQQK